MKRKRGHKEGTVNRAAAAERVLNVINLDNSNNMDEYGNDEYESPMEVDMQPSTGTDQPINVANINPNGSIDKAAGKPVGRGKMKLKTSKLLDSLHGDTDKSSTQMRLERQGGIGERMEDSAILLAEMKMGVLGSALKKAGSIKIKSSDVLDGSVRKTGNAAAAHANNSYLKVPGTPLVDSQYSKEELDAALLVIKKVMKMDAAQPFNAPVNPEALGIPDYFDVIDTPMDFGTICTNLENGVKYMNSEDVYNDVQYIWENCNKYNNKGDYILDLMKRVKKNFMKYWKAAGLYNEQLRGSNESIQVEDVAQSSQGKMQVKGQSKQKPEKRHGKRHKHDCLCAICVIKRRKREREENARIAKGRIEVIDVQESKQEESSCVEIRGHEGSSLDMGESREVGADAEVEGRRNEIKGDDTEQQYGHLEEKRVEEEEEENEMEVQKKGEGEVQKVPNRQFEAGITQEDAEQQHGRMEEQRVEEEEEEEGEEEEEEEEEEGEEDEENEIGVQKKGEGEVRKVPNRQFEPGITQESTTVGVQTYSGSHDHQNAAAQQQKRKMSTEGISSSPSSSGNDRGSKKRKTRGPNRLNLNKIEKAKAVGVTFNEMGQPFGEHSVTLSTCCGAIVAQKIPIIYESWPKVPEEIKDSVWETIKKMFNLDEIGKAYTFKAMGNCWRAYKSRITKQIRSVPPGPDAQRRLQMLKPININDEDWNKFVQYRLSSEFQERSNHYSELSKKNATPHTTSRKGLARLREDLRAEKVARNKDPNEVDRVETWIASHKHKDESPVTKDVGEKIKQMEALHVKSQPSIKDDAVSQVLGKEHRGRVRGMGIGVTPKTVQASVVGRQTNAQLQQQMQNLMHAIANLQTLVMNNIPQANIDPNQGACFSTTQSTQYSSGSNLMRGNKSVKLVEFSPKLLTGTSTSQVDSSNGKKCKLLDWMGTGEVVAEAEIDCKDPHAIVHHLKLGPDYWRVCVKKIIVSMIPLCRSTNEFKTLEDALNSFIAWPIKYIIS